MIAHEMPYLTILLEKLPKVRKISGVKVLCGYLERQTLKRRFNFTCQLIRGCRGIILCIAPEPIGDGWTGQRNKVGNSKRQAPSGKANVPAPSPCYQSYHRVTTSMAASGRRHKNFRMSGPNPGGKKETLSAPFRSNTLVGDFRLSCSPAQVSEFCRGLSRATLYLPIFSSTDEWETIISQQRYNSPLHSCSTLAKRRV